MTHQTNGVKFEIWKNWRRIIKEINHFSYEEILVISVKENLEHEVYCRENECQWICYLCRKSSLGLLCLMGTSLSYGNSWTQLEQLLWGSNTAASKLTLELMGDPVHLISMPKGTFSIRIIKCIDQVLQKNTTESIMIWHCRIRTGCKYPELWYLETKCWIKATFLNMVTWWQLNHRYDNWKTRLKLKTLENSCYFGDSAIF